MDCVPPRPTSGPPLVRGLCQSRSTLALAGQQEDLCWVIDGLEWGRPTGRRHLTSRPNPYILLAVGRQTRRAVGVARRVRDSARRQWSYPPLGGGGRHVATGARRWRAIEQPLPSRIRVRSALPSRALSLCAARPAPPPPPHPPCFASAVPVCEVLCHPAVCLPLLRIPTPPTPPPPPPPGSIAPFSPARRHDAGYHGRGPVGQ